MTLSKMRAFSGCLKLAIGVNRPYLRGRQGIFV
jgi:hypothetical protein